VNRLVLGIFLACLIIVMMFFSYNKNPSSQGNFAQKRESMVQDQIIRRGITDPRVLAALRRVERHEFVPAEARDIAYADHPLSIGYEQTISQPYIVAYMTQAAQLGGEEKVLEIGTGSGYQAAVLAEIVKEVYTVEIVEPLAQSARERVKQLGYKNIFVKHGDGYRGWKEHAPFDVIIVTAAPDEVPEELVRQLKVGGRMVIPLGSVYQELYVIRKTDTGMEKQSLLPVRFVPMVGEGKE